MSTESDKRIVMTGHDSVFVRDAELYRRTLAYRMAVLRLADAGWFWNSDRGEFVHVEG